MRATIVRVGMAAHWRDDSFSSAGAVGSSPRRWGWGPARELLRGSLWMVLNLGLTATGGACFWIMAAHLYSSRIVGQAAAGFTSILFINYATSAGMPVALARYGGDTSRNADVLFSWSLVFAGVASTLGSVAYIAAVGSSLSFLRTPVPAAGVMAFVVIAIGCAFGVLVDIRLMAARRWWAVVARSMALALLRLPLLWAHPPGSPAFWLFIASCAPAALTGFLWLPLLPQLGAGRCAWQWRPQNAWPAIRYATVNYASTLASQAPMFLLPVIVLLSVSATANASFYVAWSITTIVFLAPVTIGQVLLLEGDKRGAEITRQSRVAQGLAATLMVAAFLGSLGLARVVTVVYGSAYRDAGRILPGLVAAGVPSAISAIALTEARVRHHLVGTIAISVSVAAMILVPALLLVPTQGTSGAMVAWIGGNVGASFVAVVATKRFRRLGVDPVLVPALAAGS